jgi:2-dehydro-3-deoxygalactonokinase
MALEHSIVVDWGTTNFRAWRLDAGGTIAEAHAAPAGILSVADGAFEDVLEREIGGWLAPGVPVLLSGMITSRNGWRETPYVEAPATLSALRDGAVRITARSGALLHFLPGVCMRKPAPDVMRGEEIQVFGAVAEAESATVILPGTHSKWVRVEEGRLVSFCTFMTGELYALLMQHSIIGRLPGTGAAHAGAFAAGVGAAGRTDSGLLNEIFQLRAGTLLQTFAAEDVPERLSGLLIGREIRAAFELGGITRRILLVGDPKLCERYRAAFSIFGIAPEIGPEHATIAGFRKLNALERA